MLRDCDIEMEAVADSETDTLTDWLFDGVLLTDGEALVVGDADCDGEAEVESDGDVE